MKNIKYVIIYGILFWMQPVYAQYNGGAGSGYASVMLNTSVMLPVEFIYFSVTPDKAQGVVHINWATSMEFNSSHFIVERSSDVLQWEPVTQVAAAGNSVVVKQYEVTDNTPVLPLTYYRIKQVDLDGAYTFSDIRTAMFNQQGIFTLIRDQYIVFPQPASALVYIKIPGSVSSKIIASKADGKQFVIPYAMAGERLLMLDTGDLEAGLYTLHFFDHTNAHIILKLIKQ